MTATVNTVSRIARGTDFRAPVVSDEVHPDSSVPAKPAIASGRTAATFPHKLPLPDRSVVCSRWLMDEPEYVATSHTNASAIPSFVSVRALFNLLAAPTWSRLSTATVPNNPTMTTGPNQIGHISEDPKKAELRTFTSPLDMQ